jgi:hypothetical protein
MDMDGLMRQARVSGNRVAHKSLKSSPLGGKGSIADAHSLAVSTWNAAEWNQTDEFKIQSQRTRCS